MKQYEVVIWDWNGTLANDVEASLMATNDILKKRGRQPITLEQYYSYIDTPISRFYDKLLDLNEVPMSVIGMEFNKYYSEYFDRLHTGAKELLQEIQAAGAKQIILSSSYQNTIEQDTIRFGIRQYFDEILAADDLLATGKVERAKMWMAAQNVAPERMVLIGDTLHDYDAAQAMGTHCILAAIGHQSEADLKTTEMPVVTTFSAIRGLLLKEHIFI